VHALHLCTSSVRLHLYERGRGLYVVNFPPGAMSSLAESQGSVQPSAQSSKNRALRNKEALLLTLERQLDELTVVHGRLQLDNQVLMNRVQALEQSVGCMEPVSDVRDGADLQSDSHQPLAEDRKLPSGEARHCISMLQQSRAATYTVSSGGGSRKLLPAGIPWKPTWASSFHWPTCQTYKLTMALGQVSAYDVFAQPPWGRALGSTCSSVCLSVCLSHPFQLLDWFIKYYK